MNTPNGSNTQNNLNCVLKKIAEIVKKSADGDYIYRGESECYDEVSSTLYRVVPHNLEPGRLLSEGVRVSEEVRVDIVQNGILEEAKRYLGQTGGINDAKDIEVLTELQHFGGKTNLIDFTEDYLIALFFACDGSHEKAGRVILLKRESANYDIREPQRAISRS